MYFSFLTRNLGLIFCVAFSHITIILILASRSHGNERSSAQSVLSVNLVNESPSILKQKVLSPSSHLNSFLSQENQSAVKSNEITSSISSQSTVHLGGAKARRTIHSPKPHYPLASRRLREEGLVIVRLCVNKQGVVDKTGISKSSGFQGLDNAALNALTQWRFAPMASNAMDDISQCFQTPVQFTLEG